MDALVQILPLVGIALIFWLLIIRPAQRRNRAQLQMQDSLEVGAEVMLTSGFYGTIRALEDDKAQVELAEGVIVTVARGAVGGVVPAETPDLSKRAPGADHEVEES